MHDKATSDPLDTPIIEHPDIHGTPPHKRVTLVVGSARNRLEIHLNFHPTGDEFLSIKEYVERWTPDVTEPG